MSRPANAAARTDAGEIFGPQLSELGKQIELLRVNRGVSKQLLARAAGTSRQQLWRVMTGKSELTATLCQKLATVLDVDSRTLSAAVLTGAQTVGNTVTLAASQLGPRPTVPASLAEYLESAASVRHTLATLPHGDDGIALKCALLNSIEDRARQARLPLPAWLFRIRAQVLDGLA